MKTKLILIVLCLIILSPLIVVCMNPPTWKSHLDFEPIDEPLDQNIQEFIYYLCYTNDIDFYIVMGLIKAESGYNPNVISKNGDYGLMQINKINHEWLNQNLGITDLLDPYQNARAGVYMLSDLYAKYSTTERVLMAYNLGESGANALWRGGVYTTKYVNKVVSSASELKTKSVIVN